MQMQLLFELVHPRYPQDPRSILSRRATRGVVRRDTEVLLLYTARYDDYSLPGGGVAPGEDIETALCRELSEETGARGVRVLHPIGWVREWRPHWGEHDALEMDSFVFRCEIDAQQDTPRMESYEVANGMRPEWISLEAAIAHNLAVMARNAPGMGMSIERETRLLQHLAGEKVNLPRAA